MPQTGDAMVWISCALLFFQLIVTCLLLHWERKNGAKQKDSILWQFCCTFVYKKENAMKSPFLQESTIPVSYLQWRIGEASADASCFLKDTADIILAGAWEEAPQWCSTCACERPSSMHQGDIEVEWDWNQGTGCMALKFLPIGKKVDFPTRCAMPKNVTKVA